ncbi:MAG: hypothetical protein P1U89_10005 [Verrucomicrobiales bacterium]|nr:hypothetical protein [Verrucomicrobiales bacterium]
MLPIELTGTAAFFEPEDFFDATLFGDFDDFFFFEIVEAFDILFTQILIGIVEFIDSGK